MLCDATLTPTAVLASQRSPDHAVHAKVRLVVLPLTDQLVDDGLLLSNAIQLGYEARIINHRSDIEEGCGAKQGSENEVPKPSAVWSFGQLLGQCWQIKLNVLTLSRGGSWQQGEEPVQANQSERPSEDASHPWLQTSQYRQEP